MSEPPAGHYSNYKTSHENHLRSSELLFWYYTRILVMKVTNKFTQALNCKHIVASDLDGGSSWWLLTRDYDHINTAWYIIFLLRSSTITDINPQLFYKVFILLKAVNTLISLMSSIHLCPSWETGPHMCLWGFYLLYMLKGFSSLTC